MRQERGEEDTQHRDGGHKKENYGRKKQNTWRRARNTLREGTQHWE